MPKIKGNSCTSYKVILALKLADERQEFSLLVAQDFFVKLFKIYLKHADVIDRVTFWGLTDGDSWKNGWPMAGRTDYPLAIDRNYNPKPFVEEIIKLAK